jgi:hypothetical protein
MVEGERGLGASQAMADKVGVRACGAITGGKAACEDLSGQCPPFVRVADNSDRGVRLVYTTAGAT